MVQLPAPAVEGYSANGSAGQVEHGLLGGGSSVTRFDSQTRRWTLSWPFLAGRDWQLLNAFDRRLLGADPWCYLNPEDANRLTLAQSLCGGLRGTVEGWSPSGGTLATDTADPYLAPSGVMKWTPAASGDVLAANSIQGGVPDKTACPYVSALRWRFTIWAKVATGSTSVNASMVGVDAAGATVATPTNVYGSLVTTDWTQLSCLTLVSDLGSSLYVIPTVTVTASTTTALFLSCPMLTETAETDWAVGAGVPRVVLPAGLERAPGVQMTSAASMTLAEAYPGAA